MTLSRNQKRQEKMRMYGEQKSRCAHCKYEFPIHGLEIDHIVPTSKGGPDIPSNWQLLCSNCNRSKGNRDDDRARRRLEKATKEDPERKDEKNLLSSPSLEIRQSDDGPFVLTNIGNCHVQSDEPCGYPNPEIPPTKTCRKAVPFATDVLLDGRAHICEVRCFSSKFWDIRPRGKWKRKVARFYGLALPPDISHSLTERYARVKVEYSIFMPNKEGHLRWGRYSFSLPIETLRHLSEGRIQRIYIDSYCDTIRQSEDPANNIQFYPQ